MENEALEPRLKQAQKALQVALDETCGVDLDEVDTGEMIRIEESLATASKAAKYVVSFRLRRRQQSAGEQPAELADVASVITRRVFDDFRGKRWDVYAVRPSSALAPLPDGFGDGWLVFESANEVRRVAPIPDGWTELTIDDLRLLCHNAASGTRRANSAKTPPGSTPPITS